MNWNKRYASDKMGPDTFFAGEGLLKVGPKTYPLDPEEDAQIKEVKRENPENLNIKMYRGGKVKFPNGHEVQINWWAHKELGGEHPTGNVQAAHIVPSGSDITDFPIHSSLTGFPDKKTTLGQSSGIGTNLDHHQVNSLMEHVKSL